MKHLFSACGQRAIETVMANRPLLAFDFDGTLAPIVPRPDDARVSIGVAQRMAQLSRLLPVAIITGRSVDDVRQRLGFNVHHIIGNHGAENIERPSASGAMAAWRSALDPVRLLLEQRSETLEHQGIVLEDKQHSLALHYRLARDREQALKTIQTLVSELPRDVRVFGGKCVVNIVAADAPDKGHAMLDLVQRTGSSSAVFIGDDVNDEAVFAVAPDHWLTVRIGRDDPMSQARFFLDTHAEVATVLHKLIQAIQAD